MDARGRRAEDRQAITARLQRGVDVQGHLGTPLGVLGSYRVDHVVAVIVNAVGAGAAQVVGTGGRGVDRVHRGAERNPHLVDDGTGVAAGLHGGWRRAGDRGRRDRVAVAGELVGAD